MAKWLRRTLPFVGMPLCDLWGWLGSSGDFDYTWQPRLHFDGCLALGIRGIAVIGSCRTGPGTHPGTHLSRLLIFELATVNWLRRFATVAHPNRTLSTQSIFLLLELVLSLRLPCTDGYMVAT
jgi:hypothetical protein